MRVATILSSAYDGRRDIGTLYPIFIDSYRIYFRSASDGIQPFATRELDGGASAALIRELCETFEVTSLDQLHRVRCWALRAFPYREEPIEGLETLDGRRFTLTSFRSQHLPNEAFDLVERRTRERQREIAYLAARIERERRVLARIPEDFIDWSSERAT